VVGDGKRAAGAAGRDARSDTERRFEPWPWALALALGTMIAISVAFYAAARTHPDPVVPHHPAVPGHPRAAR